MRASVRIGLVLLVAGGTGWFPATTAAGQEPDEPAPAPDRAPGTVTGDGTAETVAEVSRDGSEFRISNFVYGPICRYEDGSEDICREQGVIRIDGQETCVWVGEERPCTWYGIQFDYANKDPEVPIHCEWMRSHPVNDGNYEEVRARGITSDEYDLQIDDTDGHYYGPMYNLYGPVSMPWLVVRFDFRCSYDGEEILHAPFRLVFSSGYNR